MTYRPRWGFLIAGVLTMGPGLLLGALALDAAYNRPFVCDDCAPLPPTVPRVVLGGIAGAGATLLIIGLIGHDVPAAPTPPGHDLAFLPFVTPDAEGLAVSMRW